MQVEIGGNPIDDGGLGRSLSQGPDRAENLSEFLPALGGQNHPLAPFQAVDRGTDLLNGSHCAMANQIKWLGGHALETLWMRDVGRLAGSFRLTRNLALACFMFAHLALAL